MEKQVRYIVELKHAPEDDWVPVGWGTGLVSHFTYFESSERAEDYIDRISRVVYAARVVEVVETFKVITEFPNLSLL